LENKIHSDQSLAFLCTIGLPPDKKAKLEQLSHLGTNMFCMSESRVEHTHIMNNLLLKI